VCASTLLRMRSCECPCLLKSILLLLLPSSLASKRPKSHIHDGAETLCRFQARSPGVASTMKGRTTPNGALGSSHKLLPPPRRAGVDHKPSATAAPPCAHAGGEQPRDGDDYGRAPRARVSLHIRTASLGVASGCVCATMPLAASGRQDRASLPPHSQALGEQSAVPIPV
jgi:hypothetical protein